MEKKSLKSYYSLERMLFLEIPKGPTQPAWQAEPDTATIKASSSALSHK
jgi:hypothetical protein